MVDHFAKLNLNWIDLRIDPNNIARSFFACHLVRFTVKFPNISNSLLCKNNSFGFTERIIVIFRLHYEENETIWFIWIKYKFIISQQFQLPITA